MAMFIVQVSFGFQLPGLRRHKGFPISEGGGTSEIISRKGMMRLIMIKILLMVLIKLLIILTIKLIMYLVMLYVLLMMAAMIKKNFFSSAWPTGRREALTTLWRWWTAATWTDSSWSPALGWRFKKIMMIVMTIMMMLVVEMTTRVAVTMNFKILALHRCFVYKEVHTGFLLSQVWRTITIVLEMKRRIEIVHAYFKRSSKCTS